MQLQLAESERQRVKLEEDFEGQVNALRQTLDKVVSVLLISSSFLAYSSHR